MFNFCYSVREHAPNDVAVWPGSRLTIRQQTHPTGVTVPVQCHTLPSAGISMASDAERCSDSELRNSV